MGLHLDKCCDLIKRTGCGANNDIAVISNPRVSVSLCPPSFSAVSSDEASRTGQPLANKKNAHYLWHGLLDQSGQEEHRNTSQVSPTMTTPHSSVPYLILPSPAILFPLLSHFQLNLADTTSLGVLRNLTGLNMDMPSLQTIQNFNLQHTDVLEKLKMQVRDMKVNLNVSRHDTAAASVANSNHMQLFHNPSENRTPNTSTDASEFRHHRTRHSLCRLSCPVALHATTCPRTCRPTDCPHPLHLPARPRTRMPTRHRHGTTPDLRRRTATGALRNSSNKSAR